MNKIMLLSVLFAFAGSCVASDKGTVVNVNGDEVFTTSPAALARQVAQLQSKGFISPNVSPQRPTKKPATDISPSTLRDIEMKRAQDVFLAQSAAKSSAKAKLKF